MELINKYMGTFAHLPVQSDSVEHGIGDDQQAGRLELFAQVVDVEYHYTLIQVHIAGMTEDVQRTGGKQLQR